LFDELSPVSLSFKKENGLLSKFPSFKKSPNSGSPRRLLARLRASPEIDIDLPPAVWNLIGAGLEGISHIFVCILLQFPESFSLVSTKLVPQVNEMLGADKECRASA